MMNYNINKNRLGKIKRRIIPISKTMENSIKILIYRKIISMKLTRKILKKI